MSFAPVKVAGVAGFNRRHAPLRSALPDSRRIVCPRHQHVRIAGQKCRSRRAHGGTEAILKGSVRSRRLPEQLRHPYNPNIHKSRTNLRGFIQ